MPPMQTKKQTVAKKPLSLFRTIQVPVLIMPRPKGARELDIKEGLKNKFYLL